MYDNHWTTGVDFCQRKNHCDGPGTAQKMNLSMLYGGKYGTTTKMDALFVYDAFQTFGKSDTYFKKSLINAGIPYSNRSVLTPVVQWSSYSPLDPRFAGTIPDGVDGLFQSVKILGMTSFGREVKPWVPCCTLTARKRTSSRN